MYEFTILCEISKVPFEISHTILNPHTAKYALYEVLKIWSLMISLSYDILSLSETGPWCLFGVRIAAPSWVCRIRVLRPGIIRNNCGPYTSTTCRCDLAGIQMAAGPSVTVAPRLLTMFSVDWRIGVWAFLLFCSFRGRANSNLFLTIPFTSEHGSIEWWFIWKWYYYIEIRIYGLSEEVVCIRWIMFWYCRWIELSDVYIETSPPRNDMFKSTILSSVLPQAKYSLLVQFQNMIICKSSVFKYFHGKMWIRNNCNAWSQEPLFVDEQTAFWY